MPKRRGKAKPIRALPPKSHLRKALRAARRAGWVVTFTGHGLRWRRPDGKIIFTMCTPSCHRGKIRDFEKLWRAGLEFSP